jgi:predicted ATPase
MLAQTLRNAAVFRYHLRDAEGTRVHTHASINLAEQYGFGEQGSEVRSLLAWAMTELEQTNQELGDLGAGSSSSFFPTELTLEPGYLRSGRASEALELIRKALTRVESTGAYIGAPELYRFMARALLLYDPSATVEAETCFRKAVEIARGQSAKWWELRATVSLARLLDDTGHRDEARTMLAAIYNWFTEGFDTADLKEAKVLLDELST